MFILSSKLPMANHSCATCILMRMILQRKFKVYVKRQHQRYNFYLMSFIFTLIFLLTSSPMPFPRSSKTIPSQRVTRSMTHLRRHPDSRLPLGLRRPSHRRHYKRSFTRSLIVFSRVRRRIGKRRRQRAMSFVVVSLLSLPLPS